MWQAFIKEKKKKLSEMKDKVPLFYNYRKETFLFPTILWVM